MSNCPGAALDDAVIRCIACSSDLTHFRICRRCKLAAEIPFATLAHMILVEELSFEYPAHGPKVLVDINLRIDPGERLAIIGATGSGKSTLARCLNGLNLPTSGRVEVDGFESDDSAARAQVRRLVGLVFQNPDDQLICATVEDEIAFGLESLGTASEVMARRVGETLQSFQLENLKYHPPHHTKNDHLTHSPKNKQIMCKPN